MSLAMEINSGARWTSGTMALAQYGMKNSRYAEEAHRSTSTYTVRLCRYLHSLPRRKVLLRWPAAAFARRDCHDDLANCNCMQSTGVCSRAVSQGKRLCHGGTDGTLPAHRLAVFIVLHRNRLRRSIEQPVHCGISISASRSQIVLVGLTAFGMNHCSRLIRCLKSGRVSNAGQPMPHRATLLSLSRHSYRRQVQCAKEGPFNPLLNPHDKSPARVTM